MHEPTSPSSASSPGPRIPDPDLPRRQPDPAAAPHSPTPSRAIWTLRLWGLRHPDLDVGLSLALVALLAWSRFAFLASGPW